MTGSWFEMLKLKQFVLQNKARAAFSEGKQFRRLDATSLSPLLLRGHASLWLRLSV